MEMMSATRSTAPYSLEDRRHLEGQDRADAEAATRLTIGMLLHADADHLRPQVPPPQPPAAAGEQRRGSGGDGVAQQVAEAADELEHVDGAVAEGGEGR